MHVHRPAVRAFKDRIKAEARPYASVEWLRKFPTICHNDSGRLVHHAAVLNRAFQQFFVSAVVGQAGPGLLANPFDDARNEVRDMRDAHEISPQECEWHLEKFERERTEVLEIIAALHFRLPQLGELSFYFLRGSGL